MKDGEQYFIPTLLPPYYSSHSWGVNTWLDRHAARSLLVCKTKESALELAKRLVSSVHLSNLDC